MTPPSEITFCPPGTVNNMTHKVTGAEEAYSVCETDSRMDGTRHDSEDMSRMGRTSNLRRSYRSLSAMSFTLILAATWEFLYISNTQGLIDGGLSGVFWTYIWNFVGFFIIMLSLAEMASMAPISGGQYHWVSEFAPPKHQKFLSYITGWISTLSWQAGSAASSYLTGTIIQGLVTVTYPDYEPKNWRGSLLIFGNAFILLIFNIWGSRAMPTIQNLLLILHIFGLAVVFIILVVLGPRNTKDDVFSNFTNGGGWSSMGLSMQVGQISAIYSLICSDATAHMAEEVKDASRVVPRAMMGAYTLNGLIGLLALVSYLYSLTDLNGALNDPSGYPIIWAVRQALSAGGTIAVITLILTLVIFSNVSFNAATSRTTMAFARDQGLPFSNWISRICPYKHVPCNAILLTCLISCLLGLINIGSSVAFDAIVSVQVSTLMFTYVISISCVLYRRIKHPDLLPPARWSLGRLGPLVNVFGICYSVYVFFWSFWPATITPGAADFNWSAPLFVAVFILSLVMYFCQGRYNYEGPVTLVKGR